MTRIAIIGGHGKIALRLATILSERGDEVTAIIRNPDHEDDVAATGAKPLVADIEKLETAGIASVLSGHDAVVWLSLIHISEPTRPY